MDPDNFMVSLALVVGAVALVAIGLIAGDGMSDASVIRGCNLQGSFVIDGKVYDCTPRTKP